MSNTSELANALTLSNRRLTDLEVFIHLLGLSPDGVIDFMQKEQNAASAQAYLNANKTPRDDMKLT